MCSSTDDLTLNYGLYSPQDLMLFFFLLRHDSPNKLLLALRWMSFPGTHRGWFNRVHTTVSLEERYQKTPLCPRLPHRLRRGHLSCVNSPGRHCQRGECLECGLMVSGPVSQSSGKYCFQSRTTKAPWSSPHLRWVLFGAGISSSGVMTLTSWSASWGPPSSKHISSHVVQGCSYFGL